MHVVCMCGMGVCGVCDVCVVCCACAVCVVCACGTYVEYECVWCVFVRMCGVV